MHIPCIWAAFCGVLDPKSGEAMTAAGACPPPLCHCDAFALLTLQLIPATLGCPLLQNCDMRQTRDHRLYM